MMKWIVVAGIVVSIASLFSCSDSPDEGAVDDTHTAPAETARAGEDIWEFCARIGTSDDWLADPPLEKEGYVFRCFKGQALQCPTGATGGACMKLSDEEPPGLAEYCTENPDVERPPLSVIGHGPTVRIWRCVGGHAVGLGNTAYNPAEYDDAGFMSTAWSPVPSPAP
jgi:hypothetical protein